MNLSKNNFSKNTYRFKQPGKIDTEGTIYTYETNKALYDIAIIGGVKYYQFNMNGYTTDPKNTNFIYNAIENHYNI